MAATATSAMPMSVLAYTGLSDELVMEPGPIAVSAGTSSADLRSTAEFTVTGDACVIAAEQRAFLSEATVTASATTLR